MIYFIRHGQTHNNVQARFSGHQDIALTDLGFAQAKEAAKNLKNVPLDICFCSPLQRAVHTMQEIMKYHKDTPIVVDPQLIERDYGELEGKLLEEGGQHNRWKLGEELPFKGFESADALLERVKQFYKSIDQYKGKNVLIVAHSAIAIVSKYLLLPNQSKELTYDKIGNAEVLNLPF